MVQPKQGNRRPRRGMTLRQKIGVGAFTVFLLVLASVLLGKRIVEGRVRLMLEDKLASVLGIEVEIDRIQLGFGEQRVIGVVLLESERPDEPIAQFDAVWLRSPAEALREAQTRTFVDIGLRGIVRDSARFATTIANRPKPTQPPPVLSMHFEELAFEMPTADAAVHLGGSFGISSDATTEIVAGVQRVIYRGGVRTVAMGSPARESAAARTDALRRMLSGSEARLAFERGGEAGGGPVGMLSLHGPNVEGEMRLRPGNSLLVLDGGFSAECADLGALFSTEAGEVWIGGGADTRVTLRLEEAALDVRALAADALRGGRIVAELQDGRFDLGDQTALVDASVLLEARDAGVGFRAGIQGVRSEHAPFDKLVVEGVLVGQDASGLTATLALHGVRPSAAGAWASVSSAETQAWMETLGADGLELLGELGSDGIALAVEGERGRVTLSAAIPEPSADGVLAESVEVAWDVVNPDALAVEGRPGLSRGGRTTGVLRVDGWQSSDPLATRGTISGEARADILTRDGHVVPVALRVSGAGDVMSIDVVDLRSAPTFSSATIGLERVAGSALPSPVELRMSQVHLERVAAMVTADAEDVFATFGGLSAIRYAGEFAARRTDLGWSGEWVSLGAEADLAWRIGEDGSSNLNFSGVVEANSEEISAISEDLTPAVISELEGAGLLAFEGSASVRADGSIAEWNANAHVAEGGWEPTGTDARPFAVRLASFAGMRPSRVDLTDVWLRAEGGEGVPLLWELEAQGSDESAASPGRVSVQGGVGVGASVLLDVDVGDIRLLERALGVPGLLEPAIGRSATGSMNVRLDGERLLMRGSVVSDLLKTDSPVEVEVSQGLARLTTPLEIQWLLMPAAVDQAMRRAIKTRSMGPPIRLRHPVPTTLTISSGAVSLPLSGLESVAFDASVEIAGFDAFGPGHERIAVEQTRVLASKELTLPVEYSVEGRHALGRLENTQGMFHVRGGFSEEDAQVTFDIEHAPSSVVRSVIGFGPTFDQIVGPTLNANGSRRSIGSESDLTLSTSSEHTTLAMAGRLDDREFRARGDVHLTMRDIDPDLLSRVLGGSTVLRSIRQSEDQGPATLVIRNLVLPRTATKSRLSADFSVEALGLELDVSPKLDLLMGPARLAAGRFLSVNVDRMTGTIRRGVVELDPFVLRALGMPLDIRGTVDTVMRSLDIKMTSALQVPLALTGSFNSPSIEIDLDRIMGDDDESELPPVRRPGESADGLRRPGEPSNGIRRPGESRDGLRRPGDGR